MDFKGLNNIKKGLKEDKYVCRVVAHILSKWRDTVYKWYAHQYPLLSLGGRQLGGLLLRETF